MKFRKTAAMLVVVAALGVVAVQGAGAQTDGPGTSTFTESTRHVTTTQRTDLPDAAATTCGTAATPAALVDETSAELEPVSEVIVTFGPDVIMIGEDESVPYEVADGETNFNTRTTYETVVTQTFQAMAAGAPCAAPAAAVEAAARFTG